MNRDEAGWASGLGPPGPGDVVGHYTIERLLGSGGMASVFEANDPQGETVALKILDPSRVLDEDVKRFAREYEALSRMDHDNIVEVFEAGVHEGYPWITMELIDGTDLESEIASWQASDPPDRFVRIERILRGLCQGLAYIHEHGLVHRDLKPSNVLLTRDQQPKISDFGLVKGENTASTQLTMAGRLVGTVAFMAPELITDEDVDLRADLYALGAVLYMMCTFRRPIEAESVAGYLARHLTEVPRAISELEPAAPRIFEQICQRLLQKDRTLRYPNAQAILQTLDRTDAPKIPPLRGRDELLQRWARWLLQLQEGAGSTQALQGAPGSGRSHLLEVLIDQARSHGLRIATACGHQGSLLQQLAEDLGATGACSGDTLEASLRSHPTEPTLFAVDDADAAPVDEIRELARLVRRWVTLEARPLLLLLTVHEAEGELAALLSGSSTGLPCAVVALEPLDPKSTIAMVRDRGICGPVAPALGRRLHAMYRGIPGAMLQQLEALIEAGWLSPRGDQLRPTRPLDQFRRGDLPVPEAARVRIEALIEALDPRPREIIQLMSLLDRPASAALIEGCRPDDPATPRLLDELVRQRLLSRATVEHQEVLSLHDPCAARIVRSGLQPEQRQRLHGALASALIARRRRANALEIARHLQEAGDLAAAWPTYIQAARRAARDGRFSEVLEICSAAAEIAPGAAAGLPEDEALEHRRWLNLLQGEALVARRAWLEALEPLSRAVEAARTTGDPRGIARCVGLQGRALYRLSRFDEAAPLLQEALRLTEPGAPDRGSTVRALADIELRRGNLELAETLWNEALSASLGTGSRDAEARARRGLAHSRALRGRLVEASELLSQADDLLNPDGDYRVRAAVLTRAAELDITAGRLGSALYRTELLIELARRHGLGDRMPLAYAAMAQILRALGEEEGAISATEQALVFAEASEGPTWSARLQVARVLMELERPSEAWSALPPPDEVPPGRVDDPEGQLLVLHARFAASTEPSRAEQLCRTALARRPPLLIPATATIALDASRALFTAGQATEAAQAAARGLRALRGPGSDGLRLELLLAQHQAAPGDETRRTIQGILERMTPLLPPQATQRFAHRADLRRLKPDP
ncbi:MAG TPA: hypothetical protein ENK18_17375 [Deltaproteobacteria bacterium]|nr:hypothetical protein [Deltaproteobacteria bacterium]